LEFEESEYELVESILLGEGNFNSLQREFIELFETKTIIAGPGAGKTTALAAKIVLLLKYLNRIGSKDGVCIITYTNVAVKEINTTLQKAGISNVSHPNFIGTIHEFFNRFCLLPYFKKEYSHSFISFSDSDRADKDFYKMYMGIKEPWIKQDKFKGFYERIADKIHQSRLVFDELQMEINIENTTGWEKFDKYKEDMLKAKLLRKKQGFLQYEDTFLFAKLFLNNSYCKDILTKRFKYIFIDEFQDTTPEGVDLFKKIFDSDENVMQMIGDPYQTIMYDQPMPECKEEEIFSLNITNRFGKEISQPLNLIAPKSAIQVYDDKKSFKPILLIYKTLINIISL